MRIGLFGFTFSHENMGCQALTCAFLDILSKNFPEEKFEVIVFRPEKTLGIIPKLFPNMTFTQYKIKLKDRKMKYMEEFRKCDIIFDETYGDGFSDIYFVKSVYISTIIKILCGKSGTPFVLTPQTYGPFKRKSLEWLAGKAIKYAQCVYARDQISADYASEISHRNVGAVTDLAFVLKYQKNDNYNKQSKFGLNISGLLWKGGFYSNNQFGLLTDYQKYCRDLIHYAQERGFEVHLIPHVTKSMDETRIIPDGDYPVCEMLAAEFDGIKVAPCFIDPYEAKNYIATMDYFVGARMHSTIAAFSSGVKTIPFAYSRKFKGLYENLEYPYYIDGTAAGTSETLKKTFEMIENPEKLEYAQNRAMIQVSRNIDKFEKELVQMIRKLRDEGKKKYEN